MTSTEIATIEPQSLAIDPAQYFKPQLTVQEALHRERQLVQIIQHLLKPTTKDQYGNVVFDGADYGTLPGTKTKTLFQPGAEKLALFFGLTVTATCIEKNEDWEKGFFRYTFKATVSFRGLVIRETTRTCHTREKKYSWIWVERPAPPADEQREMKETETGRWGTKWVEKRKTNVWQERRPNPDPWSLQFVVEAMAQKRAKVAAVKEALAATGYFSKEIDFDDYQQEAIDITPEPTGQPAQSANVKAITLEAKHEGVINSLLFDHYSKPVKDGGKGPNGKAYVEGFWLAKSFAEREAEAKRLGLITSPALEVEPMPDAEPTAAAATEPDERAQLLIEVDELIEAAKAPPLNRTMKEVKDEIRRQIGENDLTKLSLEQLTTLKDGLTLWLGSLRKK